MRLRDWLTMVAIIVIVFVLGIAVGYYGGSDECIERVERGDEMSDVINRLSEHYRREKVVPPLQDGFRMAFWKWCTIFLGIASLLVLLGIGIGLRF